MLRPVLAVAAVGVGGYALWKILWVLLLPLIGTLVGFMAFVVKAFFILALVLIALWVFKKVMTKAQEVTAQ